MWNLFRLGVIHQRATRGIRWIPQQVSKQVSQFQF